MAIMRRYKCAECGCEDDKFFSLGEDMPKAVVCLCGGNMYKMFCRNFYMDTYVPGVNAEHDREHAENYYNKRLYSEDENKAGVNHLA